MIKIVLVVIIFLSISIGIQYSFADSSCNDDIKLMTYEQVKRSEHIFYATVISTSEYTENTKLLKLNFTSVEKGLPVIAKEISDLRMIPTPVPIVFPSYEIIIENDDWLKKCSFVEGEYYLIFAQGKTEVKTILPWTKELPYGKWNGLALVDRIDKAEEENDEYKELDIKIAEARAKISNLVGEAYKKTPISFNFVNNNHTLVIALWPEGDSTIEEYEQRIREIIGDIPFSISIGGSTEESSTPKIESPLKQTNNGINMHELKCKQDRVLVLKQSNESAACVKKTTAEKLVQRGWGTISEKSTSK